MFEDLKNTIIVRARIVTLFMMLFGIIIICKITYIQYVLGPSLRKKAAKIHYEEKEIKPIRGNIIDVNGNILATDLTFYHVILDPSKIKKEESSKIRDIAKAFSMTFGDNRDTYYADLVSKHAQSSKRYLLVNKKKINYEQKLNLEKNADLIDLISKKVIIFEKSDIRFSPFKFLASRTLGYQDNKSTGIGLERQYNDFLAGSPGKALYKRTIGSVYRLVENSTTKKPVNGYDVETCIDINLQDIVHSSFIKVLAESMSDSGCAVIMEVASGEVRAMVNLTRLSNGSYVENYNHAIASNREPGSVFKVLPMIAIFEETGIELDHKVDLEDGFAYFYDRKMVESNELLKGLMTIKEAFAMSTNIGLAKLMVEKFGSNPKNFINFVLRLGMGQLSGIDLPGEAKPFIPDTSMKIWSGTTLPWMTIGYCVQTSPIKILQLYNAIANNGVMVKPMLVKRIVNGEKIIKTFETQIVNSKICSDKTLQKIKILLEEVVESGTGKKSNTSYYKIAAKTGTANILKNGRYSRETYITFVGYFPADKPKYSFIFVMDCPKSMNWHFGASLSKIVKVIADKLASQDLSDPSRQVTESTFNKNLRQNFKYVNYKDLQYFSLFASKKIILKSQTNNLSNVWCNGFMSENFIVVESFENDVFAHLNQKLFSERDYIYLKDLYSTNLRKKLYG